MKGPAAKMFAELGVEPSASAVANHYSGVISSFVLDNQDAYLAAAIQEAGIRTLVRNTVMRTAVDRRRLAEAVLDFAVADRR